MVFGSDLIGTVREHLATLSASLTSLDGFYTRFGGAKRFNIVLVAKGAPFKIQERLQCDYLKRLRDVAVVYPDDRAPDEDAHAVYGVDHARGAVVVVRPDLWVGWTGYPEQIGDLGEYFGGFLEEMYKGFERFGVCGGCGVAFLSVYQNTFNTINGSFIPRMHIAFEVRWVD